jgi:membrane complex biogenesis BtpA family protein
MAFLDLFPAKRPALIGMVHLLALPGTPGYGGSVQAILDAALRDAATLKQAGMDAILIENMHDLPYLNRVVGPEIGSTMTVAAYLIRRAFDLPTGVQVLAGANRDALAVALAAGLDFIRAEGFVFGHVADEGWMDGQAGELLRYRKQIEATGVHILTDIKKKHSAHAATADVNLVETARAAAFFRSDGLIVTGSATGQAADLAELRALQGATALPVIVGSGIDADNVLSYAPLCDAMIVGSSIKVQGRWELPVDLTRAEKLVNTLRLTFP